MTARSARDAVLAGETANARMWLAEISQRRFCATRRHGSWSPGDKVRATYVAEESGLDSVHADGCKESEEVHAWSETDDEVLPRPASLGAAKPVGSQLNNPLKQECGVACSIPSDSLYGSAGKTDAWAWADMDSEDDRILWGSDSRSTLSDTPSSARSMVAVAADSVLLGRPCTSLQASIVQGTCCKVVALPHAVNAFCCLSTAPASVASMSPLAVEGCHGAHLFAGMPPPPPQLPPVLPRNAPPEPCAPAWDCDAGKGTAMSGQQSARPSPSSGQALAAPGGALKATETMTLAIRNLPKWVRAEDVRQLLDDSGFVGAYQHVRVPPPGGHAFVTMRSRLATATLLANWQQSRRFCDQDSDEPLRLLVVDEHRSRQSLRQSGTSGVCAQPQKGPTEAVRMSSRMERTRRIEIFAYDEGRRLGGSYRRLPSHLHGSTTSW